MDGAVVEALRVIEKKVRERERVVRWGRWLCRGGGGCIGVGGDKQGGGVGMGYGEVEGSKGEEAGGSSVEGGRQSAAEGESQ